jgi:hypothetical protein
LLHNDIIISKKKTNDPRSYLPTLTPADDDEDDDEPLGPIVSPFDELTNDD